MIVRPLLVASPAVRARVEKLAAAEAQARLQGPGDHPSIQYVQSSVVPRGKAAEGTIPMPLADLSGFNFASHTQPDGHRVRIEVLGGLVVPDHLPPGGVELPPVHLPAGPMSFIVFGDSGKGDKAQRETAKELTAIAHHRGVQFGVHVGDIYYPHGIAAADDPAVKSLYVEPYAKLPNVHAILGNHDYGNVDGAGVPEAVVDAAKADTKGIYVFPQRYYTRRFVAGDTTVRILFIDTNTLPVDPIQLAWIRRELAKDSDYTIVAGHHPVYNNGWRGASAITRKLLLPLLDARADLYICGHEHNQQVLHSNQGLPVVITGAAAEARETWKAEDADFSAVRRGAAFFKIDKDGIAMDIVAAHAKGTTPGRTLFSNTFERRERKPMTERVVEKVRTPAMPLAYYRLKRGHSEELSVEADKKLG